MNYRLQNKHLSTILHRYFSFTHSISELNLFIRAIQPIKTPNIFLNSGVLIYAQVFFIFEDDVL